MQAESGFNVILYKKGLFWITFSLLFILLYPFSSEWIMLNRANSFTETALRIKGPLMSIVGGSSPSWRPDRNGLVSAKSETFKSIYEKPCLGLLTFEEYMNK